MKRPFLKTAFLIQLFLLFAHLYNNRHGLPISVIDEQSKLLVELMRTYPINLFGTYRTLDETIWGYNLTWALFTLFPIFISGYCILAKTLRLQTGNSHSHSIVRDKKYNPILSRMPMRSLKTGCSLAFYPNAKWFLQGCFYYLSSSNTGIKWFWSIFKKQRPASMTALITTFYCINH